MNNLEKHVQSLGEFERPSDVLEASRDSYNWESQVVIRVSSSSNTLRGLAYRKSTTYKLTTEQSRSNRLSTAEKAARAV